MVASWPGCPRWRREPSRSRTQGEANAGAIGEPEDADMRRLSTSSGGARVGRRPSLCPVSLLAREPQGLEDRVRLRLGLADLVAGLGVGHDAAAGLDVHLAVLDQCR